MRPSGMPIVFIILSLIASIFGTSYLYYRGRKWAINDGGTCRRLEKGVGSLGWPSMHVERQRVDNCSEYRHDYLTNGTHRIYPPEVQCLSLQLKVETKLLPIPVAYLTLKRCAPSVPADEFCNNLVLPDFRKNLVEYGLSIPAAAFNIKVKQCAYCTEEMCNAAADDFKNDGKS